MNEQEQKTESIKLPKARLIIEFDPATGNFTDTTDGPIPGGLLIAHLEWVKFNALQQQQAAVIQQQMQAVQRKVQSANGLILPRG